MPSRKASIGSAEAFFRVATGWRGRQQSGYGRCRQSGMGWARSRRKPANRSTRRSRPWSSRVTAKVSPLGRIQMSSRSFDTSIPANTSTSRPCTCGLAMRPRRLFGMLGWTDGAPCSRTGSCTPGAKRQRDRWEIQGARRATWRSRATAAILHLLDRHALALLVLAMTWERVRPPLTTPPALVRRSSGPDPPPA